MWLLKRVVNRVPDEHRGSRWYRFWWMLNWYFCAYHSSAAKDAGQYEIHELFPRSSTWLLRTPLFVLSYNREVPWPSRSDIVSGWNFACIPNLRREEHGSCYLYHWNNLRTVATSRDVWRMWSERRKLPSVGGSSST